MVRSIEICLLLTLPISGPDGWISLLKVMVWPTFWAVMVFAWRSKLANLLSAAEFLLRRTETLKIGSLEVVVNKPEEVPPYIEERTPETIVPITPQPSKDSIRLYVVPERRSKIILEEPSPGAPEENQDK